VPEIDILGFLLWYFAFLFSITAHEAAHAWAAHRGGDPTAYLGGQVSLSPLPHIRREPLGTVLVPLFSFFARGWMWGWASASYDPLWVRRYPRRAAAYVRRGVRGEPVHCRGPVPRPQGASGHGPRGSAVARPVPPASGPGHAGGPPLDGGRLPAGQHPAEPQPHFRLLQPAAAAPMDGYGIVSGRFRDDFPRAFAALDANPMFSLLGIFVAWSVFSQVFGPVFRWMLRLLVTGVL
jgi:hypothetical protein